jgi:hypothetical protein
MLRPAATDQPNAAHKWGTRPLEAHDYSELSRNRSMPVSGTGVTTYSLHPGAVKTELQRHVDDTFFWGARFILFSIGTLFMKTPEEGAQTTVYCSVDETLVDKTGLYYA